MRCIQWVGHEEVRKREIKGHWKRYTYFCNGIKCFIYCEKDETFLRLFANWCSWAQGNYIYTFETLVGEYVPLEDIIMDEPDSKPFSHCKLLIHTQHGDCIQ
jgi:hypothetical protein